MFEPKYVIDEKLLNLVIRLEVIRARLFDLNLSSEWEQKFKKDAVVRRVFYGLKIEGENLSLSNVEKIVSLDPQRDENGELLAKRLNLKNKEKVTQLVINLLNAEKYLSQLVDFYEKKYQSEFSEKELKQIHALAVERLVPACDLSVYRKTPLVADGGWRAPQPIELEYQLEALFLWLKRAREKKTFAVFVWAIFYAELVRISPFAYGNNIVAVLALRLGLGLDGYGGRFCLVIEKRLDKENFRMRELVVSLIQGGSLEEYLDGFVEILADLFEDQYAKMKRVALAWNERELKEMIIKRGRSERVALSERQAILLREIELKGELFMAEARKLLPSVSDDTLWRDLRDLMAKKMIIKKGKTKGARYLLSK